MPAGSRRRLWLGKDAGFQSVAEAGLWFVFAVTNSDWKSIPSESGNVISSLVLVRFLVSVGTCKKTFHKASSSFGIMGFESPSGALDVHNICWLYV